MDNRSLEMAVSGVSSADEAESGFAATCVEFPEANGQGETVEACLENLRGAIRDVLAEQAAKGLLAGERLEVVYA